MNDIEVQEKIKETASESIISHESTEQANETLIKNLIQMTENLRSTKSYSRHYTPIIFEEIEKNISF